ncbi:YcaO-like family protein [Streptomyces sp. Li-HN-5-11]|uniref:YcaO-like family protein n=1 Tax=Streptomyces sp. Li-HN-5-11 TaxID=3075432 RepID=UPI0028AD5B5A|nr:YcaO-like family protein [Streptomyces sp. Li-HN-5-11]WNM29183.1 YcaO-like family protein [Streptomyces sp. Li-HN-5-11]
MRTLQATPQSAAVPESLRRIGKLVSPYGLVSRLTWLPVTEGEPDFAVFSGSLGDPGAVLAAQAEWTHDASSGNFDGAGGALDRETAAHLAAAESLERYSSCAWSPQDMIWATAEDLGEDAIPPWEWPNLSAAELADARCGLVPTDRKMPLRWVEGWSLTRGRKVYVPAVQVYLKCSPESAAERYVHPVSTGCATHADPLAAVANGLMEVVERDSIALTWLQRLRLPRLEFELDDLAPEHLAYVERAACENIRTLLFDATTDLGIPVIYGVQLADHDRDLAQLVVATCDTDPGKAIAKLHREAASLRIALRSHASRHTNPDDPQDIVSVIGGALLAGKRDRRDRFDFLLEGDRPVRAFADLPRPVKGEAELPWLLDRLSRAGCEVVVVDITTDEARQVGATVVRVLVPQLMPLSFAHRARYLATPRLYEAPRAMGHPVHDEDGINPSPQPFA